MVLSQYHLINKLIRFILTLFVFTSIMERAFSITKHVKIMLHDKIDKVFFVDSIIIYIEWKLDEDLDSDLIIDKLYLIKHWRV
jgi:hypothetical protein